MMSMVCTFSLNCICLIRMQAGACYVAHRARTDWLGVKDRRLNVTIVFKANFHDDLVVPIILTNLCAVDLCVLDVCV